MAFLRDLWTTLRANLTYRRIERQSAPHYDYVDHTLDTLAKL